ncbi:MAG: hypothetical protein V2J13_10935, partial [Cycloclasticus sp.]|nr:hypothetical protein [Cycloclasticus sp.]
GVQEALLDQQADALGIATRKVFLPAQADMKTYNHTMHKAYEAAGKEGIDTIAFGDIYLEDLKNFRERQVEKAGLKADFPLWQENTTVLINSFVDLGFKTIVVALDSSRLSRDFLGRIIDHDFIKDLPEEVDPCGENGEFHTFVIDGPLFEYPLNPVLGEVVERHYPAPADKDRLVTYYFQDLLPG